MRSLNFESMMFQLVKSASLYNKLAGTEEEKNQENIVFGMVLMLQVGGCSIQPVYIGNKIYEFNVDGKNYIVL